VTAIFSNPRKKAFAKVMREAPTPAESTLQRWLRREPPQQVVDMGCPLSGGALVLRQGPHGDFLGCSDYPECEYTEEI